MTVMPLVAQGLLKTTAIGNVPVFKGVADVVQDNIYNLPCVPSMKAKGEKHLDLGKQSRCAFP